MEEHKLEILEQENKGKVYKKINLKARIDKRTGSAVAGIPVGKYIIVKKLFPDGMFGMSFSDKKLMNINVEYQGEQVGMTLYDTKEESKSSEYKDFCQTGGVGDIIKISAVQKSGTVNGASKSWVSLEFTKVE